MVEVPTVALPGYDDDFYEPKNEDEDARIGLSLLGNDALIPLLQHPNVIVLALAPYQSEDYEPAFSLELARSEDGLTVNSFDIYIPGERVAKETRRVLLTTAHMEIHDSEEEDIELRVPTVEQAIPIFFDVVSRLRTMYAEGMREYTAEGNTYKSHIPIRPQGTWKTIFPEYAEFIDTI